MILFEDDCPLSYLARLRELCRPCIILASRSQDVAVVPRRPPRLTTHITSHPLTNHFRFPICAIVSLDKDPRPRDLLRGTVTVPPGLKSRRGARTMCMQLWCRLGERFCARCYSIHPARTYGPGVSRRPASFRKRTQSCGRQRRALAHIKRRSPRRREGCGLQIISMSSAASRRVHPIHVVRGNYSQSDQTGN